jgi:hypothetical protein
MPGGLNKKELQKLAKSKKSAQKSNGREIARATGKTGAEQKQAAIRRKYGPAGKPAPVTVKKLDGETGEWVVEKVVDQSKLGTGPKRKTYQERHWRPKKKRKGSLAGAERALAANREQIERSSRGTKSRKPKEWRMGQGPGSSG